MSVSVTH